MSSAIATRKTQLTSEEEIYFRSVAGETAIHEAGHAVALFLLGRGSDIIHVSAEITDTVKGTVRHRPSSQLMFIENHVEQVQIANGSILVSVAGHAASVRVRTSWRKEEDLRLADVMWDELVESCWSDPDSCGCDYHSASRHANLISASDNRAMAKLLRVWEWADELFDIPRAWNVVRALADRLTFGSTLSGAEANQIMFEAWGANRVSIGQLGRKWSRRFENKLSTISDCMESPAERPILH